MPNMWVKQLIRLGILALAGTGIGALYGHAMLGLVVALSIAIGFHLYWLITLYGWLHGRRMRQLPEGSGERGEHGVVWHR